MLLNIHLTPVVSDECLPYKHHNQNKVEPDENTHHPKKATSFKQA